MFTLPTCTRCRSRKIRCDRKTPKCAACDKSGSQCLIENRSGGQSYTRQYAQELIDEIQRLEAAIKPRPTESRRIGNTDAITPAEQGDGEIDADDGDPPAFGQRFVGETSGLSFLRYVFESNYFKAAQDDLAHYLRQQQPIPRQPTSEHDWPPFEEAKKLVHVYLNNSHVHHPFLRPSDIETALYVAYQYDDRRCSPQVAYLIFMVFAIASVLAFRSRLTLNHPYGYFLTAQKYQERVAVLGSLEAIQNLLLIARFGMYHEINTSLWELSQICIRQCIELNLHLPPREPITIQMDQLRRCVFWDCYMNERYSAGTLGRPFSIADQNIEVALPYELTDEELLSMGSHNSVLNPANRASTIPNDKSVFLFAVGLRRIQSQNKSAFRAHAYNTTVAAHRRFSVSTVGVIACELEDHLRELDSWLSGAPVFPSPKNTYQHQDWYAFLTEKEKLSIIRAAMACLSQSQTRVPRIFLKECATSAIKVIQLFTAMFDAERITWTRSYFQVLFVAGLSLMFCLSVHTGDREDDLTDPLTEYLTKGSASGETSALDMCSRVLLRLSKEMPDSRAFYLIFEVLTRRFDVERTTSGRDRDAMVARGAASLYNQQSSHQLPSVSMNRPASGQNNPVPRSDPNASSSVREQYNQARHLSRNNEQEQLAIGAIPSSDHHTSTASLLTPSSWRRHQDYTTTEQSTGMMESVHTRMDLPSSPSVEIQVPGWLSASSQYQSESIEFVHPGWGAAQATEDTAASSSAPPLPISASQIADASISSGLDDYNMDWSMTFTDEAMDEMVASLGEYVWGDTGATRVWGDLDIQM